MIQPQTHLNVADNSGAGELMCIRIVGASNRRYAHIGDVIVVVIKDAVPNMPLERSEVVRAVIVRTCKEIKRDNGMIIRYDDNAAIVIDQERNPKGTQVFGAIARELRQFNFTKIVTLAPEVSICTLYSSLYYLLTHESSSHAQLTYPIVFRMSREEIMVEFNMEIRIKVVIIVKPEVDIATSAAIRTNKCCPHAICGYFHY
ncbi:unnamed protein product [Lactuca virosa]|uniref:Large ribosomal subunit protein uL14c n=1 Tax=Lactuca virosa TaxID=75947 RepID=A0AAU9LYL2_9ASTR|nr:unnamed protein product [Lactuca virosa]